MHIFKDTRFDFLRWRWHAIALSWLIIIAGVVVFLTKGIPLGIEFAGGTAVILEFFRYDMSLNVIAAILTMTGFSTNDTIVIFDRIRENLRGMRRDSLHHVINASINQTLGRTVIVSGTALLTALALFFFGGEVLHGFAFTIMGGIITRPYSSVFIAAAIDRFWR